MNTVAPASRSVQPVTAKHLEPLKWWLVDQHYHYTKRYPIEDYALEHRTLAGVVDDGTVDREDEAEAYQVLEECFPEVPYDDPSWFAEPVFHAGQLGDADFWELGPAIPADALVVPPIAGGAPEADDEFTRRLNAELDAEAAAYWPEG